MHDYLHWGENYAAEQTRIIFIRRSSVGTTYLSQHPWCSALGIVLADLVDAHPPCCEGYHVSHDQNNTAGHIKQSKGTTEIIYASRMKYRLENARAQSQPKKRCCHLFPEISSILRNAQLAPLRPAAAAAAIASRADNAARNRNEQSIIVMTYTAPSCPVSRFSCFSTTRGTKPSVARTKRASCCSLGHSV